MLRVVLDTNVMLVSVSRRSSYNWIFIAFLKKAYQLAVSNEILSEYEEQLAKHWHPRVASAVIKVLAEAPNTIFTRVFFRFNLIATDPDDNKFSDCFVASQADYLVTFDKDFDLLKTINFPKINVIAPATFKIILEEKSLI